MRVLTILLLTVLLGAPVHAQQYQEPEDVLMRDQAAAQIPHNNRAANAAASSQEAARQAAHPVLTTEPGDAQSASSADASSAAAGTTDTDLHGAAPAAGTDEFSSLDPITARFLRRLQNEQTLNLYLQQNGSESTALHSGAPLAGSGPAETASVAALFLAVGWTLWRARRAQAAR
jgi:hypothetical protein